MNSLMDWFSPRSTVILLLATSVTAQFVPYPTDLTNKTGFAGINIRYKQVPNGICETDPHVKSYAGYADVGENEHLFFWFFESRNTDPTQAPLGVWVDGGPGTSSMSGLFQDNGPCSIGSDGNVINNPYSWTNVSNFLWIDQPVTTGFSYTKAVPAYQDSSGELEEIITLPNNSCPEYVHDSFDDSCGTYSLPDYSLVANSTANAASNVWKTIQGFMGVFPEYSRGGIHLLTISYGGHYGPVFSEYFETQNMQTHGTPNAHNISLQSVTIWNGWLDPIAAYEAYYNFTVSPGNTYDLSFFNESVQAELYNAVWGEGNCVDQLKQCQATGRSDICSTADNFCEDEVQNVFDLATDRNEYDVRELTADPFPPGFYVDYLGRPEVQKAIGAIQNYTDDSSIVGNSFDTTGDDGREAFVLEDVQALLKQGVSVSLQYGDADYNCNWLGGQAAAEKINVPGYSDAGYTKIVTADNVTHGEVRQAGRFSFSRMYQSGHDVPFYQPLAVLTLYNRTINKVDMATGHKKITDSYRTSGPKTSVYREGNSTVQYKVWPPGSIYNTTTNEPNPLPRNSSASNARRGLPDKKNNGKKQRFARRFMRKRQTHS